MDNLKIKNLGPIVEADIDFGDLTLFVGPQASGKSIVLQLVKLIVDKNNIKGTLIENNYDWSKSVKDNVELYFGENTSLLFNKSTSIKFQGKPFDWKKLPEIKQSNRPEKLFYVPAQRVLTMSQGWPRSFSSYDIGDPYVLKQFSETIRLFLDKLNTRSGHVFPQPESQTYLSRNFDQSIFHGGKIISDSSSMKKRFLLKIGDSELPFMTWSAGQKEFMPLLLSFYLLTPQSKSKNEGTKWVIIEEPEMGLHPKAIQSVMLVFLELIARDYKLIVSTHSSVLLELLWTIRMLQARNGAPIDLANLFSLQKNTFPTKTFKTIIEKKVFKTYYFEQEKNGVHIKDISTLDAGDPDHSISNWGGLSDFSSRANEIVTQLSANEK